MQAGQELDLPVYFGDAGSGAVLHSVGAHRAACAVITLDTPGANYRTVWALHKNFPKVKIYVRAHDVHHGLNLEKAGATAVVPETLEPSLQLAAAVLSQLNMPQDEVTAAIQQFRRDHISELQVGLRMPTGTPKPPPPPQEGTQSFGTSEGAKYSCSANCMNSGYPSLPLAVRCRSSSSCSWLPRPCDS